MDLDRALAVVRAESAALADAGRQGLEPAVEACPGWTVQDLLAHVGAVQAWVTVKVEQRPGFGATRDGWTPPPPEDGDWPGWFAAISDGLVAAFDACDPDATTETWAGVRPTRFWFRRMAQEVAVHRWDGEAAHGGARPIDTDVAADGIDELLTELLPRFLRRKALANSSGWTMVLDAGDDDRTWQIEVEPVGVSVADGRGAGEPDVVVHGTASDVLLWLWNRATGDALTIEGPPSLAERWRTLLRV